MDRVENEDGTEGAEFENKLQTLEYPFTWDMDDIDNDAVLATGYKPHDEEEFIPLLKLMRIVMLVFVQTKKNEDPDSILENLEKCDDVVVAIKEQADPNISIEAVMHVLQAMQCHVFWTLNRRNRAKVIFEEIKSVSATDKIARSTINACRSIGWSKYHLLGTEEAVDFSRKAIADNPECDLCYFILGKNLRRIRRDMSVGSIPNKEEADAFIEAYEKSKNVVYGIFVAQMYREQRSIMKAIKMYEEIYRSKPKSYAVYLRLALGFLQLMKLPLAKMCLDEVAVQCPDDVMYLHYRGKYHMKTKKFREAIYYLKKAADRNNCPAAKDYLRCMLKVNPLFNATEYLLTLVERYKDLPEKQIQGLVLETAYSYLTKGQMEKSLKHFLHSIEIDPKSQTLTEFYSLFRPGQSQNVYKMLAQEVFPRVRQSRELLDESALETYEDLKNYYDEYLESQLQATQTAFSKFSNKCFR
ncbi:uncharacterized protein LOC100679734 isoform X1 [Nasonia vitripennis]|uniref:Cell division cycle protein 27 homolog n=1 Tax=Nasonia vitripennis TaxID=7425 RepID=A0A7M7J495_NASVI|nr:uncharacterized protein LOC100679734 isoform X1 [Nasonia vitripennis]